MKASLRAFLDGLIDYAGLFPPASLDMPQAVATYARHLGSEYSWMVGRFVCPLTRVDAFAAEGRERLKTLAPIRVAGLSSTMAHAQTMMQVAGTDAGLAHAFEREGWGHVDVLEVRLPDDLIDGDPSQIRLALERYESALRVGGMKLERIFYEVTRTADWVDHVERIAAACAGVKHRGFKIRCGGVAPEAYPSVDEVASAISVCARLRVPYKATAGLHHPVRHERPDTGVTQHGFFNVFAAGLLAATAAGDHIHEAVDERNLSHFDFRDERLAWHGQDIRVEEIARTRRTFAISYGSCDIDEPIEDLSNAGLL